MSYKSDISWTDSTWNPIRFRNQNGKVGHYCEKVSPGCAHCYAERMQPRFGNKIRYNAADLSKGNVFLDDKVLMQPLRWKKPRMIFVCSMSDLFGEWVDDETIDRVFSIMGECRSHTFQVLTKRPERMAAYLNDKIQTGERIQSRAEQLVYVPPEIPLTNVWLGTSVEDQQRADERIPHLLRCPAAVRFLSVEPLLGPIDLSRYIGYNPTYEKQTPRRGSVRSSETGPSGDRPERGDLEGGRDSRESLEQPTNPAEDSEEAGRTRSGAISTSEMDDEREKNLLPRASFGLAPLQGADTRGTDGESQERDKKAQQTEEPGIGDSLRTNETCLSHGPEESARTKESGIQIDGQSGAGDSSTLLKGKSHTEADCETVSGVHAGHLKDSEGRQTEETIRASCGLYTSQEPHQQTQKSQGPISWTITGGESGPKARPMNPEWARSIRDQCQAAGVSFFFKQWGEWVTPKHAGNLSSSMNQTDENEMARVGKKLAGRLLDGREWNEMPNHATNKNNPAAAPA